MTFHIGQNVVCVRDTHPPHWEHDPDFRYPKRGCVYTVREIDGGGLRLHEIVNPKGHWGNERLWFDVTRFRPVVTTDIAIFTAMLAPTPHKELVSLHAE